MVTIVGSKEAQQTAKSLIQQSISDSPYSMQNPICRETPVGDKAKIDFSTFNWTEANKQCVSLLYNLYKKKCTVIFISHCIV